MSRQKSAFSSGRHVRLIIHRNVMGAIKGLAGRPSNYKFHFNLLTIFVKIDVRAAPKKRSRQLKHKTPQFILAKRGALLYSIAMGILAPDIYRCLTAFMPGKLIARHYMKNLKKTMINFG